MRIFAQFDKNDCGISVLQSLIYARFDVIIPRSKLYEDINITSNGLDVLELERQAKKFGIILESYWLSFEEFKEIENKKYFITIINLDGISHYVIVKKYSKKLVLFDSARGKLEMTYEEFKSSFLNIYIDIQYSKKREKVNLADSPKIYVFDIPRLISTCVAKAISFAFLIISFHVNKMFLVDVINSGDLKNLGYIIFFSFLMYVCWTLSDATGEILNLKIKKTGTKDLYKKLFHHIENKKNFFYQKFGEHNILYLHQHIQNIALFASEHMTNIILNSFISVMLLLYMSMVNTTFLVIIVASIAFQIGFSYLLTNIKKQYFPPLIKSANSQRKLFFYLDGFLKKEWNKEKLLEINTSLKSEINHEIDLEESMNMKNLFFEKINFFIFNMTNVVFYSMAAWWSVNQNIAVDQVIFAGILFFYINKSFSKMIESYFFYGFYQKSLSVYKNWINIDNIDEKEKKIEWSIPKTIEIKGLNYFNGKNWVFKNLNLKISKNTFIFGASGTGKSTLYKFISNKLFLNEKAIYFDGILQNDIDQQSFNKSIIYQVNESHIKNLNWNEIFNHLEISEMTLVKNTLDNLDIDISNTLDIKKLSSGQKQAINILYLLKYSNKIILLDESVSQINHENKHNILKNIFPILCNKNFVICSEHDLSIKKYFDNYINLTEIVNSCSIQ